MSAIAMRMRTHKGLSAIQQGIALLRRLGDRASVFVPGVASASGAHWINGASLTPTGGVQSLGPNLIANGDFSNGATGWTLWQPTAGVVQLESGGMRLRTTDATFAAIQPALTLSPGSTYQVTFTVRNWVNGSVQVSIDGTTAAFTSPSAAGTYTFPVVASGSCVVQIKRTGGSNCDLIVDDLSCQLVTTMPTSAWLMDYVESTAAAAASVDGPVGFLSDGSGTIGPELAPQSLLNWSTYNTPINVTDMSAAADAVADGLFFTGLVVGQQYQLSFTGTSTATITFQQYGGSTIYQTGFGTSVFTAQETRFLLRFGGVGTATFTKMSVRAITGRHATQGTGANKPTLRRGPLNLQTWSWDFTNAAWAKSGVAVVTGQLDPFGGSSAELFTTTAGNGCYVNNSTNLKTSATYTRALIAKAGTASSLFLEVRIGDSSYMNTKFDLASKTFSGGSFTSTSYIDLPNGFVLVCATWDTASTGAQVAQAIYLDNYGAATGNKTITLHSAGVFEGRFTAAQIAQCGAIPLTTTTPVSSTAGNYRLNYSTGGMQSLALPSAPFAVTDDHIVVQGLTVGDASGTHASFAMANGNSRFPVLYVGAGGYPSISWRDDTGVGVTATAPQVSNGESFVLTARKVGSAGSARKNGVVYPVTVTGLGTTTATAAFIGASTGGTINWAGDIYPTVIVRGALSDAELLVLERFVGALTGPTGVKF